MLPFWIPPFPVFVPAQVHIGLTELSGVTGGTVNIGATLSCSSSSGGGGGGPSISNTMASVQGEHPFIWIGYGIVLDGQRQARGSQNMTGQAGGGTGAVDPPAAWGEVRYLPGGRPQSSAADRRQVLENRPSGVTMIG